MRVPGAVVPADRAAFGGALRVRLNPPVAGLSSGFAIVGPDNAVRLRRPLRAVEAGRAGECGALADTVALIVERYLHEIGIEAVVPPALVRSPWILAKPWRAELSGGWWSADSGAGPWTLRGSAARALRVDGGWFVEGGFRVTGSHEFALASGTASMRRMSVDLVGYRRFSVGGGEVQLGAGVGLTGLQVAGRVDGKQKQESRYSPEFLGFIGFCYPLTQVVFARFGGRFGMDSVTIVVAQTNQPAALQTSRYHGALDLGLGLTF